MTTDLWELDLSRFKPYYKWITFNIVQTSNLNWKQIGFKPYYKWITFNIKFPPSNVSGTIVLNLIINGLPSIWLSRNTTRHWFESFKPYYKWITFNIFFKLFHFFNMFFCFKPYYKWITFNIILGFKSANELNKF